MTSAGTTEDDDEGVGVADALMMEEVAAGVAGALLDIDTEVDSADDVGDADDGVGDVDDSVERIAEKCQSMSARYNCNECEDQTYRTLVNHQGDSKPRIDPVQKSSADLGCPLRKLSQPLHR